MANIKAADTMNFAAFWNALQRVGNALGEAERLAKNASIASVAMLPALFLAFLQRWQHLDPRDRLQARRPEER